MIPKDIEEKLDPLPFHAWCITVSAPIPNPIKRAAGLVVLYFIILLGDMVVLYTVEVIHVQIFKKHMGLIERVINMNYKIVTMMIRQAKLKW